VIVDFHTHVFPPQVRDRRKEYLRRDATFREIYSDPRSKLASAEEVLASMDEAGVDVSVIVGFAWGKTDLCRQTNDYILEAAGCSGGRLVAFCCVPAHAGDEARTEVQRCAAAGARGLGELRPEPAEGLRPWNQGYDLADSEEADLLAWASSAYNLPLLLHVSEPVGHGYPGKRGLDLSSLYHFVDSFPDVTVVAAHWGGGLPFYALMPEVKQAMKNVYFDTAASPFLYSPQIYRRVADLVGADRILFGTDYPLLSPTRLLDEINTTDLSEAEKRLILSENTRRLLGLGS
jgi:predicted TIM-barrel fold metal-dependent hydrolase